MSERAETDEKGSQRQLKNKYDAEQYHPFLIFLLLFPLREKVKELKQVPLKTF